jgi:peptidoglycan/xylan/chitin deacetylase (PgdA/CDA1 family)
MVEPSVPVLMYHSVGIPNDKWQWNYLTTPYDIFEKQLSWLKRKGYQSISLQHLYEYMNEKCNLPKNPIVLTFDDGYLDNWVFAYPLLKKYGFNAIIYISPEFADPRNIIRKNLNDTWANEIPFEQLETQGYLSWAEMKEMEKEGVVDIQSHTMSHTWYPISNTIIDFRHPGDSYIWMSWNKNPDTKYVLQYESLNQESYGLPVYEHGRALGIKRYFNDTTLDEYILRYVQKKDLKIFFNSSDWKGGLFKVVNRFQLDNSLQGREETREEYLQRVNYELSKSKEIIERKLDKTVNFLCWPGGAVTNDALKIAKEVGYLSSTIGKDKHSERNVLRNRYGEDPSRINRISTVLWWDGREEPDSVIKYENGFFLILSLYVYQGKKVSSLISGILLNSWIRCNKMLYNLKYR